MDAVVRFVQALKGSIDARKLYPAGHNLVEDTLRRLNIESSKLLETTPVVALSTPGNDVMVNGVPVGPRMVRNLTTWLTSEFARIGVNSLTLRQGANDQELRALVAVLLTTDAPAAAKAIAANGSEHVVFDAPAPPRVPEISESGARSAAAPPTTVVLRSKDSELEESAKALMRAPLAEFLSPETEKTLPALFSRLMEAKLSRLMEPIVDRLGAGLRETDEGLRRQAAASITKLLEPGPSAAREFILRRIETPLAAATAAELEDPAVGNAVHAWLLAATLLKQHKLMLIFMSRIAGKPDLQKRAPSLRAAIGLTLQRMGTPAMEEAAELISRGDPLLREGAGRVAAMIGTPMSHSLVALIVQSGDLMVRRVAAGTLKEIGEGTRQLALHVKPDAPAGTLRNVLSVYELSGPGGPEISSVLRAAAQHADLSVREAAAGLLVRAKSLASPILVSELLALNDGMIQRAAITVAKDEKIRQAAAGILKLAEQTQDEDVLRAVCNYFRECPTREAIPILGRLFNSRTRAFGLLKGMSDPTRVAAVEALRRVNDPEARKMIDRALTDGSDTVRRAAKPPGA
jgi:HEAT repeat protein